MKKGRSYSWRRSGCLVRIRRRVSKSPLPSVLLANAQSLENKLNDLRPRLSYQRDIKNCNILCFTESWLNDDTDNIELAGFSVHRQDKAATSDGQENAGKCPHQGESEGDEPSFGDLSNDGEMKSPHKSEEEELGTPFVCNGASAGTGAVGGSPPGGVKTKTSQDSPEKKFPCSECTQTFRTKSYLNKHVNRVHHHGVQKSLVMGAGLVSGSGLGDLGPSLGSPFSPQQNMSLLESFGFQIVQSAFASSLVDSEAGHSGMELGGK